MFLFSVFSTQAVKPDAGSDKGAITKNIWITAKCHVALIDGSEAIIFHHIKSKNFHKLKSSVAGQKVLTQKSPKKIKVYKASECVMDEDDFISVKAQALDKKTER